MSDLPTNADIKPVEVYALPTGQLTHPDRWLFEDGAEDLMKERNEYPVFSFLIKHHSGKHVLFDLGLAKDLSLIPPSIMSLKHIIRPTVHDDATDILQRGPVSPSSITAVILSHLHFDHIGDCTKFPNAELVVGPGSKEANGKGWPTVSNSPFSSAPVQHPKFRELSVEKDLWKPVGPFPRGHDYFGDDSFILLDAPGHMPGHLGALALTGTDEWVFIGGDCCHHRSILVGARPMSVTCGPKGQPSFHCNPDLASQTIQMIRELQNINGGGKIFVALAHDHFLVGNMPLYPEFINGWSSSDWKRRLDLVLAEHYA